ncbi:hypothetical protein Fmac_031542 [Flemingia macrophylla]|uniref:Fe2OG dioxygenase domain-containing protein n=1 Tax=Flemingia macrophylla TaxID=520843 RepID=A0ABD1L2D2_9FABA
MFSVKELVESNCLRSVPLNYICLENSKDSTLYSENENVPIIDLSQLTSFNSDERSNTIQQLGDACRDWGFFMEYSSPNLFDQIKYGTSFNVMIDKTLFWRDYLKCYVHPHFNAPFKPLGFRETLEEYSTKGREVVEELLKGISLSLGLEENYIYKRMKVNLGSQLLVINCYPPCPNPELVMGLPAHTDHGLLTLLMQNDLPGLHIQHNGKWIPVHPLPNSFLVNTGDHMEILTNGKYKSVVHRAVANSQGTRVSVGAAHGPCLDTVVGPAPELVGDDNPAAYRAIKYRDYMQLQQNHQLHINSCLDRIRT